MRTFFLILVRRLPFTAAVIVAIFLTTAITNTLAHPISAAMLERWGFGMEQIHNGRFYQLLLAPFQVLRPYMAITIAGTLLLFLGTCEYRLGTWRAAVAFGTGHIVGYLAGSPFLALLGRLGSGWAASLGTVADVGASNGAFGAAGAVIVFLGGRARRVAFFLVVTYLIAMLLAERKVWDVEHLFAFSAGLGVGRIYLWRMGQRWLGLTPRWQIESRQRPLVLSGAVRIVGAVNIMAAFLLPHHAGFARLESWLPVGSPHWPRHLLLVTGLVLFTLAPGLARGQRSAWWGTLCALALSLGLHLQVGITRLEVVLAAVFLALLVAWRPDFRAPVPRRSLRAGAGWMASLVAAVLLYGMIGFFVLRSQFDPPVTAPRALMETIARTLFSAPRDTVATGRPAQWFLASIPVVAWLGVLYALARLLRSALAPPVSPTDLQVARQLLRTHGNSGTSYMTLWEGNSLYVGPEQQCYVAYRVHADVAVALGDPVGPSRACADTITAFSTHAEENGWTPAFYATSGAFLDDYRRLGYEVLQIGEEAVVGLPGLEFRGKEWQDVRTAANRAQRAGVAFQMFEGGRVPPEIRAQLFEISAEWSAQHGLPPMGFTLGTTDDVDDPNVNVAVAVEASGRVHAYADWLPVYARRGWVIDLMRRRQDAMNGVMDFLIAMSLMAFKERGYLTASLATAPLADLDRGETGSLLHWALGQVYEKSASYYDFRSLFRYKEKFQPQWESVYLVHRGAIALPAIAVALVRAYLPKLGLVEATKLLGESAARWLFPKEATD